MMQGLYGPWCTRSFGSSFNTFASFPFLWYTKWDCLYLISQIPFMRVTQDSTNMEEKQKPSLIERRLYARILQIMEDKKPYLDPQFNLCQLANLACTNRTRLSSTLNNQTGMNFSRWLANYRVKHLIREFSKCLTQETKELYKKAGFTSRTSFYRQFKEVTGNTPIEYFANLYYDNVNHSTK